MTVASKEGQWEGCDGRERIGRGCEKGGGIGLEGSWNTLTGHLAEDSFLFVELCSQE